MQISEILQKESVNSTGMVLYKEGIFWRLYEKSAYRFVTCFRPYQVLKKPVKKTDMAIVYCGFPDIVLDQILMAMENYTLSKDSTHIKVDGFEPLNDKEFLEWKNTLDIKLKERRANTDNKMPNISVAHAGVIEKIRNFQLINKTPVDCQLFIIELQNQLNGTL